MQTSKGVLVRERKTTVAGPPEPSGSISEEDLQNIFLSDIGSSWTQEEKIWSQNMKKWGIINQEATFTIPVDIIKDEKIAMKELIPMGSEFDVYSIKETTTSGLSTLSIPVEGSFIQAWESNSPLAPTTNNNNMTNNTSKTSIPSLNNTLLENIFDAPGMNLITPSNASPSTFNWAPFASPEKKMSDTEVSKVAGNLSNILNTVIEEDISEESSSTLPDNLFEAFEIVREQKVVPTLNPLSMLIIITEEVNASFNGVTLNEMKIKGTIHALPESIVTQNRSFKLCLENISNINSFTCNRLHCEESLSTNIMTRLYSCSLKPDGSPEKVFF